MHRALILALGTALCAVPLAAVAADAQSPAAKAPMAKAAAPAAYKAPKIVQFVESLPKSGSGKVMWRLLQDQEAAT